MLASWSRAIVLVAVAAFIGNAQCLGNCTSAACSSSHSTSNKRCHHDKKPDGDLARCSHLHSEFAGPETGLAKISLTATTSVPFLIGEYAAPVSPERSIPFAHDTGPPLSSRFGCSVSVLRI